MNITNRENMKTVNAEGGSSTRPLRCAIYTRKACEGGQSDNPLNGQRDTCKSYIQSQKTNN
ncbi:hypothetical protein FACS1894152_7420 [Bacilli bacterium]|nr:hypothetical protein FACS1894152_7420 [Bacilli bacterium]